jgi:hypothetical protein
MQMMFTVVTAALGSLTITFVVNAALQNMKTEQKNLKIRNNNKKKMPKHRLDFFFFFFLILEGSGSCKVACVTCDKLYT